MVTIATACQTEIEIKKSRFIAFLFKIQDSNEVPLVIKKLKEQYRGANHYCYAYICDGQERCFDDGEPSKTAGFPILTVLKGRHLEHVLCVVIRYFGGTLLGTGGLVKAYTEACQNALFLTSIVPLECYLELEFTVPYKNSKMLEQWLKKAIVLDKRFEEVIYVHGYFLKDSFILEYLQDLNIPYFIKKTCYF